MNKCPDPESGLAGKAESCKGCPNASKCASAKPDADIPIIRENLKSIKSIVTILSGKGGVGKSTITSNIAVSLAKKGIRTLILDFDLSGPSIPRLTNTSDDFIYESSTKFKPIKADENLYVVSVGHLEGFEEKVHVFNSNAKNFTIKKILKLCDFSEIDVMIVDTPPNITDEHLALVNYIKPNYGIVVSTPQKLALDDVIRQITFCRKANINLMGLIENMKYFTCTKCKHSNRIFNDFGVEEYCKSENIEYFGYLELKTMIAKESDSGKSIFDAVLEKISDKINKLVG